MRFPRNLASKICVIIVAILFMALFYSTVSGEDVSPVFFSEDFDGTEVDTEKWFVQENTNMSGNPAYGGSVKVAESQIFLSSSGSSFPWVQTAANPFPESGDFAVEFDFTYTCIADWGNGFFVRDSLQRDGRPTLFSIWAGDMGPDEVQIYLTLLGERVYRIIVPGWKPSTDKHFYRLEYVEGVYIVYVDGVVVASAPSERRPIRIGFGHVPRYDLPPTEEQVEARGYWGWCSFKIDSIRVVNLVRNNAQISLCTNAEEAQIGYLVDISGVLTDQNGEPLNNRAIVISQSIAGVPTWNPIAVATTDSDGFYSASWIPTATGKFAIKAEWEGDETHDSAWAVKNISVTRSESSLFFAESNSTLSSLSFNSTSKQISFTVNGPSGTTGYVRLLISKRLMGNMSDFGVYIDGRQVEFTATSTGDFHSLLFEYTHSTHYVNIKLLSASVPEFPSWIILPFLLTATPIGYIFVGKKKLLHPRS